jgi:hypothetical protein
VPVALVRAGFRFHFRAAVRLPAFRRRSLTWDRRKSDRGKEKQAEQASQRRSHHGLSLPPLRRRDQPSSEAQRRTHA